MKNGLLLWNVLLTIIAGYLLIVQLSPRKDKPADRTKALSGDPLPSNKPFTIAYFEMDSVEANYAMVKDIKAELSVKEDVINTEMDRLQQDYQKKFNDYQEQAKRGMMTQAQSEAAAQDLKMLEEQAKNRKQTLDQEYSELANRRQREVKTRIEEFLQEYNKTRNYSYIASFEQGLFYYKDTTYNITSDVVKGLNELYKVKKN